MRQLIFIVSFIILALGANAQITLSPALPTANDEVLVTFDATLGGGQMAGYTGEVYAHTGVKVEGNSQWQYVIGTWGVNSTQPKLTRIAADKYTLTISPSIREYYQVPEGKKIVELCFVFRASSGAPQTADIFANVVEEGLTVQVVSPTTEKPFYTHASTISINATANLSTSLKLFINDTEVSSTTEDEITYTHTTNAYGLQWIKAVASDGQREVSDSTYFYVKNSPTTAELPQNMLPGVNISATNEVTFVFQDPPAKKEFITLIGDFNQWIPYEEFIMNRTPDGKYHWLTLSDLDPTKQYIYQYWVEGTHKLADPYSTQISDPWNDKYISNSNYPNLIPYPEGKTTGLASVLQIEIEEYQWEATDYEAPSKSELVIYELHIRDFVEDDAIKSVTEKLDYLETLGVNAIELLPINEFEGNDSWGYNPSFYFATDKAYGTPNHYKQFIDECHKRGIAVIIDMVLNHSFGQSPFVQLYFNANAGQYGQPTADNPWFNQTCPHEPYCWGYDFNHESIYTQELIDRVAQYWLTEYKVDGFRLDFTKGFTNYDSGNQGWNYNAQRIGLLKRYADYIWSVNPKAYVILEHFTDNSEEKELAQYRSNEGLGMLIWANMNYNYNEASMGWLTNSNFNGVSHKQRGWDVPHLIGYMESHDEERLMYKNITYGNSANAEHDVKTLDVALKRQKLLGAFFFTIPGPKMIWQFGELGYDISIDENGRVGRKPIKWDYYNSNRRRSLYNAWAEMIALRKAFPVFSTDNFSLSFSGAVKRIHLEHSDMKAVIIGNFDVKESTQTITFPQAGKWFEYYSQEEIQVDEVDQSITLNPSEYRIYTTKYIDRNDFALSVEESIMQNTPEQLKLWPNPTNSLLNIMYQANKVEKVHISLYDTSGKMISTLFQGTSQPGENHVTWNLPPQLPQGLYIVEMKIGQAKSFQKLIIQQ